MNSVTVRKVSVNYVIDGVHTDECEDIPSWDTVWNEELKRNIEGIYGLWQCPYCKCVIDRDSSEMITYELYEERYL